MIAGRTMLDRVIESCQAAAGHITRKAQAPVTVAVLTPMGDPIAKEFRNRCQIVEGSEFNVLERYVQAAEFYKPTHIVRITGDCPLIPPNVVDGITCLGARNGYDYFSNVDERYRTAPDGFDCEVMTIGALDWLHKTAKLASDREHVTTLIRREPEAWMKRGLRLDSIDNSHLKYSVDTHEDLVRVREIWETSFVKFRSAMGIYGGRSVHRF